MKSSPRFAGGLRLASLPCLVTSLLATEACASAALSPILEYQFNTATNGVTPVSAGTQAAANAIIPNLTLYGDDGATPTARLTATGASGLSGDLALARLTSNTSKGVAKFVGDIPQLDNLTSFTLTFWFIGANLSAGSDRLFLYGGNDGGAAGSFEIEGNPAGGTFNLKIGSSAQVVTQAASYAPNTLTFVALTYDGSLGAAATNNLKLYSGTTASFNQTPSTFTNASGTLPGPTVPQLLIGNRSDGTRGAGYEIDNVTVFGSKTDAAGALGVADLQLVYNAGLQNLSVAAIPEPATASLLGICGVALLARRRPRTLA